MNLKQIIIFMFEPYHKLKIATNDYCSVEALWMRHWVMQESNNLLTAGVGLFRPFPQNNTLFQLFKKEIPKFQLITQHFLSVSCEKWVHTELSHLIYFRCYLHEWLTFLQQVFKSPDYKGILGQLAQSLMSDFFAIWGWEGLISSSMTVTLSFSPSPEGSAIHAPKINSTALMWYHYVPLVQAATETHRLWETAVGKPAEKSLVSYDCRVTGRGRTIKMKEQE